MPAVIHPTAIVDPEARLADSVKVGPFCYVGSGVEIGAGSELLPYAAVFGPTSLGQGNVVHSHAVLGADPQDRSYRGERTTLLVGDANTFREQVTIHRGTLKGGGATRIGSECLFMVGAHVAHDCQIADRVTLTNLTTLGGHVRVESNVVCGGHVAVAPFVRLGRGCFVAGGARVEHDVPPFVIAAGDRARVRALNRVGLERMGMESNSRRALERAFRWLWGSGEPLRSVVQRIELEEGIDDCVGELIAFLKERWDSGTGAPHTP